MDEWTDANAVERRVQPYRTTDMGGAPIGAGGHDPLLLEAKGTGGHNLGDNSYLTHCSYHAFSLMSNIVFCPPH